MLQCDIAGCEECISPNLTIDKALLQRWIIIRACQCGAYNATFDNPRSCVCRSEGPVPISYWPNVDWFAFGGVEQIVLCPLHKLEVHDEIVRQRGNDPSMNSQFLNRGNRH